MGGTILIAEIIIARIIITTTWYLKLITQMKTFVTVYIDRYIDIYLD